MNFVPRIGRFSSAIGIARRRYTFTPLYTAECVSSGGRNGKVKSTDGVLDAKVTLPKGLGGPGGHYPNPELYFSAAYSTCFAGNEIKTKRKAHFTLQLSRETLIYQNRPQLHAK